MPFTFVGGFDRTHPRGCMNLRAIDHSIVSCNPLWKTQGICRVAPSLKLPFTFFAVNQVLEQEICGADFDAGLPLDLPHATLTSHGPVGPCHTPGWLARPPTSTRPSIIFGTKGRRNCQDGHNGEASHGVSSCEWGEDWIWRGLHGPACRSLPA